MSFAHPGWSNQQETGRLKTLRLGTIWGHLGQFGVICNHLGPFGAIWDHLGPDLAPQSATWAPWAPFWSGIASKQWARAHGPGTRAQGPGPRDQGPGTRAQGPGTRDQGPGTRAQGPGRRDQGPGTRAQRPFGWTLLWMDPFGNPSIEGSGGPGPPGPLGPPWAPQGPWAPPEGFWGPGGIPVASQSLWQHFYQVSAQTEPPGPVSWHF